MRHERTTEAARGRWRGILANLGMPESYLSGKHGPCPLCGEGRDRFRFDDREGKGSWICSKCGAGDGIGLAMRFIGLEFSEAASKVDEIIRNVKPESVRAKRELTDGERQAALRALWAETQKASDGDLLHVYLANRGLAIDVPADLRLAQSIRDGDGGIRPAMVAMVAMARDAEGKPVTMHRRYRNGGEQKVTVQHVTVNEGGQAMVGTLNTGGAKKMGGNLIRQKRLTQLRAAPRCAAKAKSTARRCRGPAVKGWRVCRVHGARGGAQRGKAYPNYKHGERSYEGAETRRMIKALIEDAKALCADM